MTDSDVEVQLDKLDFKYELNNGVFTITIPRRRLDVEANKADLAEEIGRLYGYNNLVDTLPIVGTKRGEYIGDVKSIQNIRNLIILEMLRLENKLLLDLEH